MYVGQSGNGDEALWEKYSGDASDGFMSGVSNAFQFAMAKTFYNVRNAIRQWLSEILELLFQAASLCISTMRTFNLEIMAIIGPLALGISVFDGFQHTLHNWLSRYINVYLWLPVANILGTIMANIQTIMLQQDIKQIQANGATSFNSTDTGYLIFLIIGIAGYFTIPSIANYIVSVGGSDPLTVKMSRILKKSIGIA